MWGIWLAEQDTEDSAATDERRERRDSPQYVAIFAFKNLSPGARPNDWHTFCGAPDNANPPGMLRFFCNMGGHSGARSMTESMAPFFVGTPSDGNSLRYAAICWLEQVWVITKFDGVKSVGVVRRVLCGKPQQSRNSRWQARSAPLCRCSAPPLQLECHMDMIADYGALA